MQSSPKKIYWNILIPLALIKLGLHFFTNIFTNYGLHRDEYLYISESDHLAWGYMEVPPMLSIIGKMARILFGDSDFGVRFFPAFIGAVSIIIIGIMIRDMGGKKYAQLIGGFGFLISPVFLGSNNLFQPVSFNQFMWLLSAFFLFRIIKEEAEKEKGNLPESNKNWYWLGVVAGLGFLTKYSILFFFTALIVGLLLSPHRKLFLSKKPYISLGIAFIIASPNIWWQIAHDFPILKHMAELERTQLVNVRASDFIGSQFIDHFGATLIWLGGLIFILVNEKLKTYRFFAWTYIALILLLLGLSGKSYYVYGVYSSLFVFGGIAWETWLKNKSWVLVPVITLMNVPIIPLALPILPIETMLSYGEYLRANGQEGLFRWEDGKVRSLRQDYADMHGWDEIPGKVAKFYHSLSPEEQKHCIIYGGNYGHAGVMNLYKEKYNLPTTYSFNASFVAWVPEDLEIKSQIQIDDQRQGASDYFHEVILIDSVESPYARDPGLIYYKSKPKMDLKPVWKSLVQEERKAAGY